MPHDTPESPARRKKRIVIPSSQTIGVGSKGLRQPAVAYRNHPTQRDSEVLRPVPDGHPLGTDLHTLLLIVSHRSAQVLYLRRRSFRSRLRNGL